MQHVEEVLKLTARVTPPQGLFASGSIARHQAKAAIGGHAEAVKEVSVKLFKMRFPGLGGAIRRQFAVEAGRALRVNGDQNGGVAGKNLIAEIKHDGRRCHGQGRRQRPTIPLAECAERAHGVGLVSQVL